MSGVEQGPEWAEVAAFADLTADLERARSLAVRLEQELAEAERAALADKRWKLAAEAVLGALTIQGDPALSFIERVVAFGERVSS